MYRVNEAHTAAEPSSSSTARRMSVMPVPPSNRVGRACDRCRRNKSRCDLFRPCALCTRAGVECTSEGGQASSLERADSSTREWTHHEQHAPKRRRRSPPRARSDSNPDRKDRLDQPLAEPEDSDRVGGESSLLSHSPPRDHDGDHGDSAIMIAKNIYRLGSRDMNEVTVSAIPGSDLPQSPGRSGGSLTSKRAATSSYLAYALPPEATIRVLIEEYFLSVHWFSLVILEPKFRPLFNAVSDGFAKPSESLFLLLLSTMLGLAACYHSHKENEEDDHTPAYWQEWSRKLIANAERQITQLLDQSSMLAIQILTLLGSFYVYQGRPSLSFSLLGATIKAAQAARLHQEVKRIDLVDAEERRRVWWTIYTWDRFASITYGRPLGINDKDCNVAMPGDVSENIVFCPLTAAESKPSTTISFSAYQRSLNELYLIASPAIECLYSARESDNPKAAEDYVAMLENVTGKLWYWRHHLSPELRLNLDHDIASVQDLDKRAWQLQSLSLHLTFESLQLILHRPFLKEQLQLTRAHGMSRSQTLETVSGDANARTPNSVTSPMSTRSEMFMLMETSSPRRWWEAAIQIARTTELLELINIATDTHLVSFLALNLFNAAIVMVVLALSDPLNNRAQEAKRAVARIYRLQATLGSRSVLSEQSSKVIHTLIELLLRREHEAILDPPVQAGPKTSDSTVRSEKSASSSSSTHRSSVVQSAIKLDGRHQKEWMDTSSSCANLANRLDSSLASVQKVFTTGSQTHHEDHVYQDDLQGSGPQQYVPQTLPLDTDSIDVGIDMSNAPFVWSNPNFNISEGVGWFWDPSWDNLSDYFD